jgi:anthraniloyl-CoA monooxygenase
VVFSDQTLENFRAADAASFEQITSSLAHWDDIDVHVRNRVSTSSGHGFSSIARKKLLNILQARCDELGVTLRFQADVRDEDGLARYGLADADLIVAADGVNSAFRARHAERFGPDLDPEGQVTSGSAQPFPSTRSPSTSSRTRTACFQAHCYRIDAETSTFIVECDETSWRSAGFDRLDLQSTVAACKALFAPWLNGHHLRSNALPTAAPWIRRCSSADVHTLLAARHEARQPRRRGPDGRVFGRVPR